MECKVKESRIGDAIRVEYTIRSNDREYDLIKFALMEYAGKKKISFESREDVVKMVGDMKNPITDGGADV